MRHHRFFISKPISGAIIKIDSTELLRQWSKVFRFKTGDEVIMLDNSSFEYICQFESLSKKEAELKVLEKREGILDVKRKVHVYASMIKKDKFEWVLQKGTELGVASFTPVISARTEKQNVNKERAEKIITEAAEQSGWATLPLLNETISLVDALERAGNPIVFNADATPFDAENAPNDISIFIGPEGGWDEHEKDMFTFKKIPVYSLGSQTLRAETATIALCAKLLL